MGKSEWGDLCGSVVTEELSGTKTISLDVAKVIIHVPEW
jgi:hypothetical protein